MFAKALLHIGCDWREWESESKHQAEIQTESGVTFKTCAANFK